MYPTIEEFCHDFKYSTVQYCDTILYCSAVLQCTALHSGAQNYKGNIRVYFPVLAFPVQPL